MYSAQKYALFFPPKKRVACFCKHADRLNEDIDLKKNEEDRK